MTRQKSENPIVPEGLRKLSPSCASSGGKGIPVNQEMAQLVLPFATAVIPQGSQRKRRGDLSPRTPRRKPKANVIPKKSPSATMESVVEHLDESLDHVVKNKGAPGPNGRSVGVVKEIWPILRRLLSRSLRDGSYRPGEIRRVEIPKSGGYVRHEQDARR